MKEPKSPKLIPHIFTAISFLAIVTLGYFYIHTKHDLQQITTERDYLAEVNASSTDMLQAASTTIDTLNSTIAKLTIDLEDVTDDYEREKKKNDDFQDEYRSVINTVYDLDKLSKTDKELLQKYSKVYFLNENYIPSNLSAIPEEYMLSGRSQQEFHKNALPFLEKMIEAAKEDDIDLKVVSAYRSFNTQAQLKGQYTQTYGSGANAFSADQGYSEHQLGTTLDISDPITAGPYTAFENTEAFKWLEENAYRYGFILSYPKDNAYYVYEPWHWRFVGKQLARDLHRADANFYDWDQRKIDTYLINIFD